MITAKLTFKTTAKSVKLEGPLAAVIEDGFIEIPDAGARQHLIERLKLAHQKLVAHEPGGAWHNPMSMGVGGERGDSLPTDAKYSEGGIGGGGA